MAKQKAFLHIGLPRSGGELLDAGLRRHVGTLSDEHGRSVRLPARSEMEMFNAAVEIRREHRAWGLRRKDVEGSWAALCRRALKNKDTVVFSHPLLAGCTSDEIALLVDQLPGCAVHVVVTVGPPDPRVALFRDEYDLAEVLDRWSAAVRSPDRVHVLAMDPDRPTHAWHALGSVIGVDTRSLELPATPVPATDPAALRLLAESAADLATYDDLASVPDEWAKLVADHGYDARGDLTTLAPAARIDHPDAQLQLATVADALTETVAEVVRLRTRAAELEQRNTKLERKRLSLKRKLARVG
ncbi:hypothetical protein [Nocardioides sp.]|uniref:hypothetical protein n=1 Tax=Nocardioides sp. TaxID=35761 RepID=UPI001A23AB91|nr:hypothetical protein [Nocardioides sp.]MBJ7358766.1 hypothetical protein [Nocardioides sp.]